MTKLSHKKIAAAVVVLAFALSVLSAMPLGEASSRLEPASEARLVGGDACGQAWGLGIGLAAAALSPCSVVCAVFAWYDLILIGAYC
jgi:hypothetical protein